MIIYSYHDINRVIYHTIYFKKNIIISLVVEKAGI